MARGGVSGVALGVAFAGAVIAWSGLRGVSIAQQLRDVLRGQPGTLSNGGGVFGSTVGGVVARPAARMAGTPKGNQSALSHRGVPYRWGGATPAGWDCSGLVTWILHREFGIDLPSNAHTIAAQFLVWSGARTIPRSACAPGDLVCWASHIGIATSADDMVDAPTFGLLTRQEKIWSVPAPTIRRPLAYG